MTKFFRAILIPFLLIGVGILAMSVWDLGQDLISIRQIQIFGLAFLVALVFFCRFHLTPLYVFAHEMTHWLAAKMTWHETGKICIGGSKGYVEISNPTVFITLAPYFFPMYFFIVAGLGGIWHHCLSYYFPSWGNMAIAILLGVALAYHVVMTVVALRLGQSDLHTCGTFFSLSLILLANLAVIYLSEIIFTGEWKSGWTILWNYIKDFSDLVLQLKRRYM